MRFYCDIMNINTQNESYADSMSRKVAILLCTYNGQKYLKQQLESILSQSYPHWDLHVSDDGSMDETLSILQYYQNQCKNNKFYIYKGPSKGFARNFLYLNNNENIHADYFAFSDQDDIWEFDKLERAVNWLNTISKKNPALYCSRTQLIDKNNKHICFSPYYTKPPSFANALVQNIAGGNTMVFNFATRELVCAAGEDVNVCFHDWFVYQVITGCGGVVFYDKYPSVRYRQHSHNLTGAGYTWSARLLRIGMMLQGYFKVRNDNNINALYSIQHKLKPNNRMILDQFNAARQQGLISRMIGIKKSGIHRQTFLGNLGIAVAVLLKRI